MLLISILVWMSDTWLNGTQKISSIKVKMELMGEGTRVGKGGGGTKIRFGLKGGHVPAVLPPGHATESAYL